MVRSPPLSEVCLQPLCAFFVSCYLIKPTDAHRKYFIKAVRASATFQITNSYRNLEVIKIYKLLPPLPGSPCRSAHSEIFLLFHTILTALKYESLHTKTNYSNLGSFDHFYKANRIFTAMDVHVNYSLVA